MNKLLILASTLTCLCVALPVYAQRAWKELATTKLGDRIMVDNNSVRLKTMDRSRRVEFIVKTINSSPEYDGTSIAIGIYVSDCTANALLVKSFTKYDGNMQILKDYKYGGRFEPVQPGSVGEVLYEHGASTSSVKK